MQQVIMDTINSIMHDPIPTLIETLSSKNDVQVKIQNAFDNTTSHEQKKNLIQLKPDWNETKYTMPNLTKLSQVFSNRRSPNFPNQEQKHLLNKLKYIPCYTVVNDKNEIIMASPRTSKEPNSLEWLHDKYNELFFWSGDNGSISLSLFFMNKEDAASYLQEICRREPKEAEIRGLRIKTTGLDVYYRLNRTAPPKVQTRLVCDLQEIDLLLNYYIKKTSSHVNSKQKYSDQWFQGTPIYTIRAYENSKEKNISDYFSELGNKKKLIFFTREDALKAWKCHLSRAKQMYVKNPPNLEIYNLESLLIDLEGNKQDSVVDIMLIPPSDYNQNNTTSESKNKFSSYKGDSLSETVFKTKLKLKEFQRFYKGLIWLFTSDTLPSEENSW